MPAETSSRPHILYFLSDEHRGQAMGHAGDANLRTPSMDRLAEEGHSFSAAFANCPVCVPSRGVIFSGRHAFASPIQFQNDCFRISAPSTATEMRRLGYHTAYFGKSHLGMVQNQKPREVQEERDGLTARSLRTPERHRAGFQDWAAWENFSGDFFHNQLYHGRDAVPRVHRGYETDVLTGLVIDYLRAYDREEPLFLVLSVLPPHFPLIAPEEHRRHDPAALEVRPNFTDTPAMRENLANYYAMIENVDVNLGRLSDFLRGDPRYGGGESVLTYFSDHGEFMGSHRRFNRKELPQEEGVRIPSIWWSPGRISPSVADEELFSTVDVLPTTLGLAGGSSPAWVQGRDFSPLLLGEPFEGPDHVLLEMCHGPRRYLDMINWRAIRERDWKYAFYEDGHEQLYDLRADPFEMSNVAEANPGERHRLRERLKSSLQQQREPFFDVLMEHGCSLNGDTLDVSVDNPGMPTHELLPAPDGYRW